MICLDEAAGNIKWQDANRLEQSQLCEYSAFHDKGKFHILKVPQGYKQIKVYTIFDVKYDGRHKAQCIADGHFIDTPIESIYLGLVSIWGFCMVLFIAELNGLPSYAIDIGNAYLEAYTTEQL